MVSKAAQELGKIGGSAKSDAKSKAARANASKPRGKLVTVIAYLGKDHSGNEFFGATVEKGRLNEDRQFDAVCLATKNWEWVECETSASTKRIIL